MALIMTNVTICSNEILAAIRKQGFAERDQMVEPRSSGTIAVPITAKVAARERLAGARAHLPELTLLVENGTRHFSVQLHVAAQVEAVDDLVQVLLDFGLFQVARGPVPFLQQVLVEGVAVDEALGVGFRAGVAVEVPSAADAAAPFERPDPTADATRFTEPLRTSPTANIPA